MLSMFIDGFKNRCTFSAYHVRVLSELSQVYSIRGRTLLTITDTLFHQYLVRKFYMAYYSLHPHINLDLVQK